MDELLYKDLISTFFVDEVSLHSRPQRLKRCFEYVMKIKDYSTQKSQDKAKEKIAAFEATFMGKWRISKCTEMERFKNVNETWVHRALEVRVFS